MHSLTPLLAFISLLTQVLGAGNPATFWSDYPTCEETCHQSVWAASSCTLANTCACSGCLCLADSCLCETPSWLTAVAQCIGEQCGSSAVVNAASIASSACAGNGHPLALPSDSLVSIGLAAIPSTTGAAGSSTGAGVSIATSVAGATGVQTSLQSSVQNVASTAATITPAPTPASTNPSFTVGGVTSTPTSLSSSSSSSSGLSTGAKAGIAIGAVLVALVIISLVAYIFYQRRRSKPSQPAIENPPPFTGGVSELGGAGVGMAPPPFEAEKKDYPVVGNAGVAELQGAGGKEGVSPVSPAAFPEKAGGMAEMAAPLSEEERMELERRRRAAELSGERGIVVREGNGERVELEERRGVWELA